MSEQELYGQEATEQRSFGGEPIHPVTGSEPVLSPQEAADAIGQPRQAEPDPIVRDYLVRDPETGQPKRLRDEHGRFVTDDAGNELLERVPSRDWVSAEEAGQDLAATRQAEADYLKNQEAEQIRRATDELRGHKIYEREAYEQAAAQQQGESVEQWAARLQQPQQQPQPTNVDAINQLSEAIGQLDSAIANESNVNLVAGWQQKRGELATQLEQLRYAEAFRQFPELTHSISAEIDRKTALYQAQVAQAHEQSMQAARAALGATAARFPELQGINTISELGVALNAIAQSNPERYEAVRRDLSYVAAAAQNAQQIGAQHAANQAAQFESYAKQQDEMYDEAHPEMRDPAVHARVSKQAVDYLKNNIGLSDEDIRAVWNSPQGRSAAFQSILHDAAMFRENKSAIKQKMANPIKQVQRPGSVAERMPDSDYTLQALDKRLSSSGNPRDAADLLNAIRSRRR
jgi:hypothetical protein